MKYLSNVNELNKLLRQQLILQSELNSDNVINALSLHGNDLDHLLEDNIYDAYDVDNSVLIFELSSRQSSSNMSLPEEADGVIPYYRAYQLKCIIYGDSSPDIANKLTARFRSEKVRLDLYNDGIYIESIDEPQSINEYKNESLWYRSDVNININCLFAISQIIQNQSYTSVDVKIIKEGE